jgi:arylsulfatase A-like enzyme
MLLVLDTQRVDRLSCYGYEQPTSRCLDEFASDATLFRHAYAPAQWTVPSHTSMFTGLYPGQHQMLHAYSTLPKSIPTIAEILARSGYFTAAFCNNPLLGVVNTGLQKGFQSFLNYSGLMTSRPNQEGSARSIFDWYRHYFKRLTAHTLTTMQDAFARSDLLLDLSFSPLMTPLWQTALSFKGNTGRSLNHAAKLLIERKNIAEDKPIFSFINLMGTHMPYHPPRHLIERFAPEVHASHVARRQLRQFNSDVFGWLAPLSKELDAESKCILDGIYDAEVANQDQLVGEFFKKLGDAGVLDRTLVVICADHGEHLGEKHLMGHTMSLYNALVHVPLIIRDPSGDFPRGTTVDRVVSTRRIFHTLLAAAGQGDEQEQKYSLTNYAASDPEEGNIVSVGVTPQNLLNIMQRRRPDLITTHRCDQPRTAIWNDRYKLIQIGDVGSEFYDIIDDPEEKTNLYDILPEQVEILQEKLRGFLSQTSLAGVGMEAVGAGQVQDKGAVETGRGQAPVQGASPFPTPAAPTQATPFEKQFYEQNDPQVQRRLHDLGYVD